MMPERLTAERFARLAEAYGGIAHWPKEVREEARRVAQQADLAAILAQAEALDAGLDRWAVPGPSSALVGSILASRQRTLWRRVRLWWSAVGVATALAGATAGSLAALAVPIDHPSGDETVFGNYTTQDE